MKKLLCLTLAALLLLLSAGCGADNADPQQALNAAGSKARAEITAAAKDDPGAASPAAVDIDLTDMSETMAYSEVYDMLSNPSGYIGKTVKAKGAFAVYHDEKNDKYFFSVGISDVTACCSQYPEFVREGEPPFPEAYPKAGTDVVISGKFNTYMDGTTQYCHLENATMLLA